MTLRLVAGFIIAGIIALVARRTRSLSASGAIAAIVLGTIAVGAGWLWGALLILYFISSSALSHVGRGEKERRTQSIVAKGGERDAVQVLANGLPFGIAAAAWLVAPAPWQLALGAGSLAASAADTWATEIGTLYGGAPRSVLAWRPVPTGTSGGISMAGLLGSIGGAACIALIVVVGGSGSIAPAIAAGGFAGAIIDSLLGAAIQARRWCDACGRETERMVHDCGSTTRHARGLRWLGNDAVNLASAAAGGLLAALLVR